MFKLKNINLYEIIMDTQNSNVYTNDTMLDNTPSVVNINITCQSGSRLVLNNNLSIPSSVFTDEI